MGWTSNVGLLVQSRLGMTRRRERTIWRKERVYGGESVFDGGERK